MLAVAGDDGQLLAVLADGVELVVEAGLELLARDVGQLRLGHERLGLGPHQLLLQHHDARRVGLLVLELRDLVRDLLLTWGPTRDEVSRTKPSKRGFGSRRERKERTYGPGSAAPRPRCCGCS